MSCIVVTNISKTSQSLMVGIFFNIVALSKQGVTLKNIGNMPNGWIGETLSKQGVALKNVG